MHRSPPSWPATPDKFELKQHGAEFHASAAATVFGALLQAVSSIPVRSAGTRLFDFSPLRPLLEPNGAIAAIASMHLDADARPVRALMFDKRPDSNWSLGWHQDRVVAVRERHPVEGFNNWTTKSGVVHVSPPWGLLSRMVTLRIHLDPVTADNAPLLVAPGSHLLGIIRAPAIEATVASCGIIPCLAGAGDIWAYSTPILHSSDSTESERPRRVLQLDFAALDLPGGLSWRGV